MNTHITFVIHIYQIRISSDIEVFFLAVPSEPEFFKPTLLCCCCCYSIYTLHYFFFISLALNFLITPHYTTAAVASFLFSHHHNHFHHHTWTTEWANYCINTCTAAAATASSLQPTCTTYALRTILLLPLSCYF